MIYNGIDLDKGRLIERHVIVDPKTGDMIVTFRIEFKPDEPETPKEEPK